MKYVKNLIDYNKDIAKIVGFTLILFHIIIINITMYFLFLSNNIKYFFYSFYFFLFVIFLNIYFKGCIFTKIEKKLLNLDNWFGPQTLFFPQFYQNKKINKKLIYFQTFILIFSVIFRLYTILIFR